MRAPPQARPPALTAALSPLSAFAATSVAMGAQDRPQCHFDIEINREPGEPEPWEGWGALSGPCEAEPSPQESFRGADRRSALPTFLPRRPGAKQSGLGTPPHPPVPALHLRVEPSLPSLAPGKGTASNPYGNNLQFRFLVSCRIPFRIAESLLFFFSTP